MPGVLPGIYFDFKFILHHPAPLLRQVNKNNSLSRHSLDKGSKNPAPLLEQKWCWVFATLNQGKSGAGWCGVCQRKDEKIYFSKKT